jgi:hypothetical protein
VGTWTAYLSAFDYNRVPPSVTIIAEINNHWYTLAQLQAAGKALHCFTTSPGFVDAPNHDFRERADSPCIGAGVDVGLTQDHVGNVIIGFPDIGAYEYQEGQMAIKPVSFTLSVTDAPDFFPAINPTTLSVAKGIVAVYHVSFTAAGGFAGPVTLAVKNLPVGAIGTFDKTSINVGETATLSIATAAVALGTYTPSVEATA